MILDAVRQLHMAGRRVVLLGDLNCAASPIDRDYCSSGGSFARNKFVFYQHMCIFMIFGGVRCNILMPCTVL